MVGVRQLSVDDVQTEILQRLTRVETKLDMQLNAKDLATEALDKAKNAQHRLKSLEDNQRWLWRTIIGSFLLAAAAFIIKGGLSP
jgi:type IV secretory pathway component VirB8